jgi:hypothetical protein
MMAVVGVVVGRFEFMMKCSCVGSFGFKTVTKMNKNESGVELFAVCFGWFN